MAELLRITAIPCQAHVTCREWCVLIRMSEKVLRVSQLDASELDGELFSVLQGQLQTIFKLLPSTRLLRFKPELQAALKTFIWWFSVRSSGQTFGQRMMDIQYSTEPTTTTPLLSRHKWTLLCLCVGTGWLRERFHLLGSLVLPHLSPRQLEVVLEYITAAVNTLSLLNFTAFLLQGKYPTLHDRLASVCLTPSSPQTLRSMTFDLMNREILWHGFTEFLFFILPHLNMFAVRNWLQRLSLYPSSRPSDPSLCAFCEKPPTMMTVSNCGHLYCYYCLHANCIADKHFACCLCGKLVSPQHRA